jgi:regulator of nucleoside diphosphate kinase
MLFFPAVRIRRCDWSRLMRLAFAPEHTAHPATTFLRSEVHRAIVTDDFGLDEIVHLNGLVRYRLDGEDAALRQLVHPDDHDAEGQLPVLSWLGAALIGIRVGDVMPFACSAGTLHSVTLFSVQPADKRVSPNSGPKPSLLPVQPQCCLASAAQFG